jgi:thiamine-monophosphate kinase
MNGVGDMTNECGVLVIGGDTKLGVSLAICGTALGFATSLAEITPRHRAQAGDDVWVSGELGSTACAVYLYGSSHLSDGWRDWAAATLRNPNLPLDKCRALRSHRVVNAGCDISDGLGADLTGLASASSLGLEIDASEIPVHPSVIVGAQTVGVPPWLFAFASGGDFQIAVTAPPKQSKVLAEVGFTKIGRMTDDQRTRLRLPDGRFVALPSTGHRDARGMTFAQEVEYLLRIVTEALNGKP